MSTRRVAILGGGMGGLAAAWRLSEPGWRDRFSAITVFQRGWRLGGKGASSRGEHGRIEEHGLHVWLGHYDNAFRLVRDVYESLDLDWRDAFIPSSDIGMVDRHDGVWRPWIGHFAENDLLPGDGNPAPATQFDLLRRAARLLRDFVESFDDAEPLPVLTPSPERPRPVSTPATSILVAGALVEGLALASGPVAQRAGAEAIAALDVALAEARDVVSALATDVWGARHGWHLIGIIAAVVRGAIADGLFSRPGAIAELDDEEFCDWIRRHGASETTIESTYVRGLYDLVFAHAGGDPNRQGFGAGLGAVLSMKTLVDYKGAFFWKMTAGMGDVVFAPLYDVLRGRGVEFEFFHRVDALHVSDDGESIESITLGRQVALADRVERYEPLVRVNGMPCFPAEPLAEQLACGDAVVGQPLEAAWCTWPDAETRSLYRGVDFDHVVFAIPPPMAGHVCAELMDARPEWRDMVDNIATVATQSLQLWLREREDDLGWPTPGTTITGYVDGFDTWASMPQLLGVEDWPASDEPKSIAYFCNTFDSAWPPSTGDWAAHAARETQRVRDTSNRFCETDLVRLLPGFGPDVVCGQYWRANVDPSDRYVQSLPGTNKYRLRPDESGFDNMVLAGDWTDSGLNAGCIEAAVLSGLEAANALAGRHRFHRVFSDWFV